MNALSTERTCWKGKQLVQLAVRGWRTEKLLHAGWLSEWTSEGWNDNEGGALKTGNASFLVQQTIDYASIYFHHSKNNNNNNNNNNNINVKRQ